MKTKFLFLPLFVILYCVSIAAQTAPAGFDLYKLNGIGSILISSNMELQAGTYKMLSENYAKEALAKKGIEISGDSIIFQPKGLNEFKKSATYARVIIETTLGKAGDYKKLNVKKVFTPKQVQILDSDAKSAIENGFENTPLKLTKWGGVSIDTINGIQVIKTAYTRQLNDNPPVYVEMYYVENNDRQYTLTLSYRVADASVWKDALRTTKESFKVTNIR